MPRVALSHRTDNTACANTCIFQVPQLICIWAQTPKPTVVPFILMAPSMLLVRRVMHFTLVAAALVTWPICTGQNPTTIRVDVSGNRRAINPNVYGVAYASSAALSDLNVPLNRQGGNPTSRYNWRINADNRAADWYFESIGYSSSTSGEYGDAFIASSRAGGAQSMLTIPLLPYVAKLGPNREKTSSFSIAKYGPQQGWWLHGGSGGSMGSKQGLV